MRSGVTAEGRAPREGRNAFAAPTLRRRVVQGRRLRRLALAALLALPALSREARAQADTIGPPIPLFTYGDLVLAGSVVVATIAARPFDDRIAERLQDSSTQDSRKIQRMATFVRTVATPGSYIIGGGMYVVGRAAGNERLADLGLHGVEALVVGEAVATVVKGVVGRQRPSVLPRNSGSYSFGRGFGQGDKFRSFPSGHSTSAFAAAAAVSSETSRWWPDTRWVIGPILYAGAALTGVSRMYNNRHWMSDVLVGAGVGTFAGLKVVRYQHSHPGNRLDRWLLKGTLSPAPGGGQALSWSIMPAPAAFTFTTPRR
jgi:membrane-associated phospholipid phosphatase